MYNFLVFTSLAATWAGSAICDDPELKVQGLTRTIGWWSEELVITKVERDGEDNCVFHVTADATHFIDGTRQEAKYTYRIPVSALTAPGRDIGELLSVAEVSQWRPGKLVDSDTFVDLYSKTKTV